MGRRSDGLAGFLQLAVRTAKYKRVSIYSIVDIADRDGAGTDWIGEPGSIVQYFAADESGFWSGTPAIDCAHSLHRVKQASKSKVD